LQQAYVKGEIIDHERGWHALERSPICPVCHDEIVKWQEHIRGDHAEGPVVGCMACDAMLGDALTKALGSELDRMAKEKDKGVYVEPRDA
jgi:hypothetical protein